MKYKRTPTKKIFDVKGLYSVHYFKYGQNFSFDGESHDFWELVYIDSGKATITAGDKTLFLSAGQVVFHKPGEFHNIKPQLDYASSVIVSFDCKSENMRFFENRVLSLSSEEQLLLSRIVAEGVSTYKGKMNDVYMDKLVEREDAPIGGNQIIVCCLETLLIYLFRRKNPVVKIVQKGESNELVFKIKRLLQEKIYDGITLDEIASTLFFSKTHVKEIFKKHVGKTVMAYYSELKIEEAKKLIACGKYTFTQIAVRLGFSSVQYFSEKFKKVVGCTCSEYAVSVKATNVL